MSDARKPLSHIAIAGTGPIAALCALVLRKALPSCRITVIATPLQADAFADLAVTASPVVQKLHDAIGLDENVLLREAGGSFKLVTRYMGWGPSLAGRAPWLGAFAYGAEGDPQLQKAAPPSAASLGEVMANAGRFGAPRNAPPVPPGVEYTMRWDIASYHRLLTNRAAKAGIEKVDGEIAALDIDANGSVAAVGLQDGTLIAADLFVDCSGSAGHLIARMKGVKRQDFGDFFPIRELTYGYSAKAILALEDRVSLLNGAWMSEVAGREAMQRILASHGRVSDQFLERIFGNSEELQRVPFRAGALVEAWIGNLVAIGDAFAHFEPLGFFNADLAHRQIDLLVELLPGRELVPLERTEYNRRAGLMRDNVRDMISLHYSASGAKEVFGPLVTSSKLDHLLDQYTRRARVVYEEEAALATNELRNLFFALGFETRNSSLEVSRDPEMQELAAREFTKTARDVVTKTLPYPQWLDQRLNAPEAAASGSVFDQLSL